MTVFKKKKKSKKTETLFLSGGAAGIKITAQRKTVLKAFHEIVTKRPHITLKEQKKTKTCKILGIWMFSSKTVTYFAMRSERISSYSLEPILETFLGRYFLNKYVLIDMF